MGWGVKIVPNIMVAQSQLTEFISQYLADSNITRINFDCDYDLDDVGYLKEMVTKGSDEANVNVIAREGEHKKILSDFFAVPAACDIQIPINS